MDIQAMFDESNRLDQIKRAKAQLTLGKLINFLKFHKNNYQLSGYIPLQNPHSYRGHYCDLAFEKGETRIEEFLLLCRGCRGFEFTGYKGGKFTMGDDTPLWIANHGSEGIAIKDISTCNQREIVLHMENNSKIR